MGFQFNQITLDTNQFRLSRAGEQIPVEPQVFDLLVYLIENRERVVTRDELLEKLWQGKVVTDSALGTSLKDARKAVGDSGAKQQVIKTFHGRGYQFIAEVTESASKQSSLTEEQAASQEALPLPDEPSIAVLPFTNMSGDPEQGYFSDGITEDIITALSRIPRLFVVARNSTSVYKGQAVDIKQVGREQGVRFVLEGSVRKSGNQIRITAQLIDAITGNHRWAERYDRELSDIFAVQDEIAKNVTVAVQVELTAGEQARLWAGGTDNLDAWECVVQGNELMHRHNRGENAEAQRLAEQAISLDSNYADAWVLAGMSHFEDAMWGWGSSREESLTTALEDAHKAIELEELNPDSLILLAYVKCELTEFDEAVEIAQRAVSLSPNHTASVAALAVAFARAGKHEEHHKQIKRAMRLSPIYPAWYLNDLGVSCFALGKYEEAVTAFRGCTENTDQDSPFLLFAKVFLAICLAESGHVTEAKNETEEIYDLDPNFQIDEWWQFTVKDQTVPNRAIEIWNKLVSS
jgi:TolB-like protein